MKTLPSLPSLSRNLPEPLACKTWEQLTGRTQEEWKKPYLAGLPKGTDMEIEYCGGRVFTLRYLRPSSNGYDNDIFFEYRVCGPVMDFFGAAVTERGHGVAATVSGHMLTVAEIFGVKRIEAFASDVGSYLWARAGFKPTTYAWHSLRYSLALRFNALSTQGQIAPSKRVRQVLASALRSEDPRAFWNVVDIQERDKNGVRIGAALALNIAWDGVCDLSDSFSMARYKSFVHRSPLPPCGAAPGLLSEIRAFLRRKAPARGSGRENAPKAG